MSDAAIVVVCAIGAILAGGVVGLIIMWRMMR
jgi:hypothetical protein